MEIILDDREHKLAAHAGDQVATKRLTVGDILIGCRRADDTFCPLVVVERKTWPDLAASLKDGRAGNVEKLRAYRDETGAKIAYLVEGSAPARPDRAEFGGIAYRNLRAHLDHLLFTDSIIELHSTGPRDSMRRLVEFAAHLERFIPAVAAGQDGVALAMQKRELAPEQVSDRIWGAVKGISHASARAFREYKIARLFDGALTQESLAAIEINGRKFGPARAKALLDQRATPAFFRAVLGAVPHIGAKRIDIITAAVSADEFFNDWPAAKQRIGVGKACLESLEQYLF